MKINEPWFNRLFIFFKMTVDLISSDRQSITSVEETIFPPLTNLSFKSVWLAVYHRIKVMRTFADLWNTMHIPPLLSKRHPSFVFCHKRVTIPINWCYVVVGKCLFVTFVRYELVWGGTENFIKFLFWSMATVVAFLRAKCHCAQKLWKTFELNILLFKVIATYFHFDI